ncbi:MAG TPA: carboxypeptidase-like regulatory domain-containing protein [Casimicrobiaceae bacterium]|nr:carboxypeptidase-like regulatory domain-containing protein [Casimicrobiaceae bacterium]
MRSTFLRILRHRFVAVPLLIVVAVLGWNAYVVTHNDGIVRGVVLGPDGRPLAGATVTMMEQNFTTNSDRGKTMTRADGAFEFADNRSHNIQLRAEKPGVGRSGLVVVRLYFRAQDVTLREPLRVTKPAG